MFIVIVVIIGCAVGRWVMERAVEVTDGEGEVGCGVVGRWRERRGGRERSVGDIEVGGGGR